MRLCFPEFDRVMSDGGGIITSTRLLTTVASHQFAISQLERSRESWHRPIIQPLDAWLVALWQRLRYTGRAVVPALLSPAQERLLWRELIVSDLPNLFDLETTVRLALKARRTAIEWEISESDEAWNDHADAQRFLRWSAALQKTCSEKGWTTRADLVRLVPEWMRSKLCQPDPAACFGWNDTIPPAIRKLFGSVGGGLTLFRSRPSSAAKRTTELREMPDLAAEIEEAARRARAICEAKPGTKVGVLIPGLRENRTLAERIFGDIFHPAAGLDLVTRKDRNEIAEEQGRAFYLHAPVSALDTPLVTTALLVLRLFEPRLEISAAGAILRSVFVQGARGERSERARADFNLRRLREIDVSFADLESVSGSCPELLRVWRKAGSILRKKRSRLPLAKWSELFGDLVASVGWPGDQELTSQEQGAVERWKVALSDLAALGYVSGLQTVEQAVMHLSRLLAERTAGEEDLFAPVQILDSGDADNLEFDYAIITGTSDEHWPPVIRQAAFLPPRLQRSRGLPGARPELLLEEHRQKTESLLRLAPRCSLTFSGRLSPLIEARTGGSARSLPRWEGKTPRESYRPVALEEFIDEQAPAVELAQSPRGGTSIIKLQSQCPFRAFAEIRLRAQSPEDACFGFDSRDRGGFLHRALEHVWQQLKTHAQLVRTDAGELKSIIRECVSLAVEDGKDSPFHELISLTERERLENLISEWLQVEKSRKQPFTVRTLEQEQYLEIGGMRLRLRIDRVDELSNGQLVLIDYKSGKQTASKLEGERPAEPQLLVYAVAAGGSVDGIYFGQIKARELRAVGFSRTRHFEGRSATVKKDWDEYLERSRENIQKLAAGFISGNAAVDPIKGACDFCGQKPFCRVSEQLGSVEEEDDAAV